MNFTFEIYNYNSNLQIIHPYKETINLIKKDIYIQPPGAGASDAIGRVCLAYDIVTSFISDKCIICDYSNYHDRNTNFFELFAIYENFDVTKKINIKNILEINLSDLCKIIINDNLNSIINDKIMIKPDLYENSEIIKEIKIKKGIKRSFFNKIHFKHSTNPFPNNINSLLNIVFHLRRQDISGQRIIKAAHLSNNYNEKDFIGLHKRPLLSISDCIYVLKNICNIENPINIILCSDGFDQMKSKFYKYKSVLTEIDAMEKELYFNNDDSSLNINSVRHIIGSNEFKTKETMNAMYFSDYVITSASTFASLPTRFSNAKVAIVRYKHNNI